MCKWSIEGYLSDFHCFEILRIIICTCTNKQANIHDNISLMNYYCWMPLSTLFQWNHDWHGGGNLSILRKPPTCSMSQSDELTTSVVITSDCITVGRLTGKSNYQKTMATADIIFVYRCFYHYIVFLCKLKKKKRLVLIITFV